MVSHTIPGLRKVFKGEVSTSLNQVVSLDDRLDIKNM